MDAEAYFKCKIILMFVGVCLLGVHLYSLHGLIKEDQIDRAGLARAVQRIDDLRVDILIIQDLYQAHGLRIAALEELLSRRFREFQRPPKAQDAAPERI